MGENASLNGEEFSLAIIKSLNTGYISTDLSTQQLNFISKLLFLALLSMLSLFKRIHEYLRQILKFSCCKKDSM